MHFILKIDKQKCNKTVFFFKDWDSKYFNIVVELRKLIIGLMNFDFEKYKIKVNSNNYPLGMD